MEYYVLDGVPFNKFQYDFHVKQNHNKHRLTIKFFEFYTKIDIMKKYWKSSDIIAAQMIKIHKCLSKTKIYQQTFK